MTFPTRLSLLLGATALSAVALAGCNPKKLADVHIGDGGVHVSTMEPTKTALVTSAKLECPTTVGGLTRTAMSEDGAACDYQSDKGIVHLATLDAASDPKGALAPLRTQLDGELPGVAANATVQVVTERGADGAEHTKVDMPFLHVDENGGTSHVKLMGIDIKSDSKKSWKHDKSDNDDDGDEVAAGNTTAVAAGDRGVELVYVLVSGKPSPQGFHVAGYVAKGPPKGKLVVATFHYRKGQKSWSDGDRHDDDVDALMKLNVKPA